MEKLNIDAGLKEPNIAFDPDTGLLELSGRSIPENSFEVYKPVLAWMSLYAQQPATSTEFNFRLIYFNSSSAEYLLEMMKHLERIYAQGKPVQINWHYDAGDEDMEQVGEDFRAMLNIPINMVQREAVVPEEEEDELEG